MATHAAYITPQVLRWARKRSNLSVEEVASKNSVRPTQVSSWENPHSEEKPTLRQAQRLARTLHVPLGYLFLSAPPVEKPPIADLRTVSDKEKNSFSPDFIELLNDALRKQDWYRDFLQAESNAPLPFIGKFRGSNNEDVISADIARALKIDEGFRGSVPNWEYFLAKLIGQTEDLGVLVLRSGVVKNDNRRPLSVDEFRGFAISDRLAPLIFLNAKDAKAAQIFTLVHELAHLWVGVSGISNTYLGQRSLSGNVDIERRCNRIAAQVLVPRENFTAAWVRTDEIETNLARLTRRYRVSSLVILRRAFDLGKLTWEDFHAAYRHEERKYERSANQEEQEGGGNFYNTLGSRHSKRFVRTLVSATLDERTSYRDAAKLLGVQHALIEKIATKVGLRS